MARYHNIDGVKVQFTAEEETARDAEEKAWADAAPARALAELRSKRNRLLAETDYLALSDNTLSDDMKKYRQDLRDITKTYQSLSDKNFKFPTKPTE